MKCVAAFYQLLSVIHVQCSMRNVLVAVFHPLDFFIFPVHLCLGLLEQDLHVVILFGISQSTYNLQHLDKISHIIK